jgi:hypothetical protein
VRQLLCWLWPVTRLAEQHLVRDVSVDSGTVSGLLGNKDAIGCCNIRNCDCVEIHLAYVQYKEGVTCISVSREKVYEKFIIGGLFL